MRAFVGRQASSNRTSGCGDNSWTPRSLGVSHWPLRVTQPGDVLEQEADRIAARVLGMTGSSAIPPTRRGNASLASQSNSACAECSRVAPVQRATGMAGVEIDPDAAGVTDVVRDSGKPLDWCARAWFEPRFGHDFSGVRVHSNGPAAASAYAMNALAYTVGRHVVLGSDAPSLESPSGRRLLAHELVHVVQQRSGPDLSTSTVDRAGSDIVARQKKGKTPPDQAESWSTPHADADVIGQVFFATNKTDLTEDDKRALKRIADAINAWEGSLLPAVKLLFEGYADPRNTSYKGGNCQLAYDRAESAETYFRSKLTAKGKENVIPTSKSKCVDKTLAHYPDRYQRMVLIKPDGRIPPRQMRKPAKSCKSAKERCRTILGANSTRFTAVEKRHLTQILKDTTTKDGFLNSLDPELIKIAHGLGGKMTDQEAAEFVNRFKVCTDLIHHSFAGPDATDEDVIQALKGLHERIDGALDHLAKGTAKDMISGAGNQRRVKLNAYVTRSRGESDNIYFKW
ncbi:eCIS core domain-containing protein [Elioraea sp.]|uniref:eCIS core domain-containing protein n=1 Tax=Elioraea sp. TaxID=2185103 RepID=UPI003F72BC70